MKTDESKAYNKGYNAGRRYVRKARTKAQTEAAKNAFWQRAFLAALPFAMSQEGWRRNDKPIKTISERVKLASNTANEALEQAGWRIK